MTTQVSENTLINLTGLVSSTVSAEEAAVIVAFIQAQAGSALIAMSLLASCLSLGKGAMWVLEGLFGPGRVRSWLPAGVRAWLAGGAVAPEQPALAGGVLAAGQQAPAPAQAQAHVHNA